MSHTTSQFVAMNAGLRPSFFGMEEATTSETLKRIDCDEYQIGQAILRSYRNRLIYILDLHPHSLLKAEDSTDSYTKR